MNQQNMITTADAGPIEVLGNALPSAIMFLAAIVAGVVSGFGYLWIYSGNWVSSIMIGSAVSCLGFAALCLKLLITKR